MKKLTKKAIRGVFYLFRQLEKFMMKYPLLYLSLQSIILCILTKLVIQPTFTLLAFILILATLVSVGATFAVALVRVIDGKYNYIVRNLRRWAESE